jgi:diguanylate cyclase (GGDEF)-like protein
MENYRLKDFLKLGRRMKWVSKNERTCDLLSKMTKEHFDNVVVVEEMVPVGILTTKDILRLIKERVDLTKDVSHYMTQPVQSVHNNASIKEALEFIKKKHFRRVVVVDSYNKLTGIIAQKELISLTYSKWATLMKDYQQELTELNRMLESKYKEFETKAATDALTGLYNRHKFIELYISSYRSMVQRDNHMSLILMDIDFFKLVNDNYGHNIGDQVLIQVSHTLLRNLRNIDIICRWGGEEFIVLLPTVDLETAKNIAQKIKSALEKTEIEIVGHVTASFGVSEIEVGEDMDEVIARADKALYLAKESGRNCVKTQMDI